MDISTLQHLQHGHLLARQIGNMDEGVVEAGKDVCNSKYILPLIDHGSQLDLFFLLNLGLTWWHFDGCKAQNLFIYRRASVYFVIL